MQATDPFVDWCFFADYEQIVDGSTWGITWTSTNTNTPSSVSVQLFYTLEEANGPYTVTLNGNSETDHNPSFGR